MLTLKQIEEQLEKACPQHPLFFDHEHELILWWDKDEGKWCISFYFVHEDKVHVDPAPTAIFTNSSSSVQQSSDTNPSH